MKDKGIPIDSRLGRFIFWAMQAGATIGVIILYPLSLVFAPVRSLFCLLRGECTECSGAPGYAAFPEVAADAGGTLHRCPECGAFYAVPATGPGPGRKLTFEQVLERWPEVGDERT